MKIRISAFLAILVVVSACTSPAGSGQPAPSGPGATGAATATAAATATEPTQPVTLHMFVRNYMLNQDSPLKTAKADFEKKHPMVTIDLSPAPYDPQHQRILLSKAGGVQPDMSQIDTIWLGEMADQGLALNLDSYYAKWDQTSDIPDSFLASSKWKGQYYAVWAYSDTRTFLWNKDVFRKAGLDPEKPPTTWAEMIDMAKQVQAKVPGVSGIGFPASAQEGTADRWYPYLFMGGGRILNEEQTKAEFNSPAGVKSVQLLVDLIRKEKVTPPDVLTQDADAVYASVLAGRYAMMLASVGDGWADSKLDGDAYKQKMGAAMPPLCDGCKPASAAGGWLFMINPKSAYKDLVFEYISLATATPNITPFEVKLVRIPVRKSGLAQAEAFKADPYYAVTVKAAAVSQFAPWVPQYYKVVETIYTAIQKSLQGGIGVKEALDTAAADVDKLLK
ncbi:MAG TPA: ABC transporter substrate-binding protein [Candidatus Dormibacteraeota bacterium]|nr:ABC transporter substrate-binding protein [Candidatus Dormibacteraeota bacterium]